MYASYNIVSYYIEQVGTAQTLPHIRIKDRVAYIAAGNNIKLVLCRSKQFAQGLFKSFPGPVPRLNPRGIRQAAAGVAA